MGAPVLTLVDRPPVGRLGASLLGALDLRDWITETDADYIAKAKQAAADLQGLAAIRSGLRVRCEQSQLRDIDGLTRAMEHAYRKAWQNWCAAQNGQISNEPPT
jgi:predicted O-linked N-acetylglucosamine transferase (SPINDLY family)